MSSSYMNHTNKLLTLATISSVAVSLLTGCDTIKSTLNYSADEFNVADNPPLSLPPSYDLDPPAAANENKDINPSQESREEKRAKDVLLGTNQKSDKSKSKISESVVKQAKKDDKIDANIREVVNNEAKNSPENGSIGEKLSDLGNKIAANAKKTSNDPEASQIDNATHTENK